jgi:4-amino-4-deoxychorismate lyase
MVGRARPGTSLSGVPTELLAVLGRGLLDPAAPVARADDPGLTRGDGCFEGCRVRTAADGVSRVDKLDAHLARMARSAAGLELPFDPAVWERFVVETLAAWRRPGEAAMKLLLTRGPDGSEPLALITVEPMSARSLEQRRRGLRVVSLARGTAADSYAEAPWLLGGVKTLSYAVNMAALREAERRGADDVVFISRGGQLLESPTSSLVWVEGRTLYTVAVDGNGILAGTTARLLLDHAAASGWTVEETHAPLAALEQAEAAWLISSVRGPVDIVELDGVARLRRPDIDDEIRRLAGFPTANE